MPMERVHPTFNKGSVYIDYESPEEAAKAIKFMNGGQIDGQEVTAAAVHIQRNPVRPPLRRSPIRRGGPPPRWRNSPPRFNRDRRRSPPRRSPPRRRSRSPVARRRHSRSSSSSSR
ncbi:hypothetical protein RRG08_031735 [Elysia crispata]|uniref:RRM domain-containing protein n=1 Tax=Elysia crispata TaxID=231223 RepID=A0AAE0ZF72_9GAST|nr:hypothetical protein RRG08_031735 [Elysia crispata]